MDLIFYRVAQGRNKFLSFLDKALVFQTTWFKFSAFFFTLRFSVCFVARSKRLKKRFITYANGQRFDDKIGIEHP